ncbi:hypothetical protein F5884DRAFT_864021 [Xylogone sp. PMI_703]|nr:hypothetical protein F5884DRAFT_864021 [Xylogone sp. PMI_703]
MTSKAPGPASSAAIAAVMKTELNGEMLDLELKGECSVCKDEVAVGDEVAVLPCNPKHWFHEPCVSTWLDQQNTCPICRKSIKDPSAVITTAPTDILTAFREFHSLIEQTFESRGIEDLRSPAPDYYSDRTVVVDTRPSGSMLNISL